MRPQSYSSSALSGETVARIVMRAAAEHLTPITLELGGKSPCVVDSNVDIDQAASRIVWSKWMNAGQTCVAPDYVLVEEKFADTLLAAIKAKINEFYGDQPRQNQDYGRIVNERHASRLAALLENENVVIGGDVDVAERYIEPTVVMQPSSDGALMKDEIFGPILPIITVANINDSIAIINKRSKPLALYVYSNDTALQDRVLSSTSAGNVCVNDGMMFMANHNLPFGGVGNSGMGNYHGQFGFDTFSHLKSIMKRATWVDLSVRYPPYTPSKLKLLKKLL